MSPFLIAIAAFIGVAALVGGVAIMLRGASENSMEKRLAVITQTRRPSESALFQQGSLADQFKASGNFLDPLLQRFGNLSTLFEQADTNLNPVHFLGITGVSAVGFALVSAVAGFHPASWPLTGLFGAFVPLMWLLFRRRRRIKKFASQLPNALELIGRALRAGHSLAAGFHLVSQEMSEPISKEFGRVFEEQNLGIPLDEALDDLSERIPNMDLRFFCTAVILQRQTGGDLAEILDKIGHLIRERFQIWGQIQALTGEGRLSGIVLLALPPVLFLAVWRLNPDYVRVLFTEPAGRKMLLGALVLQLLGAVVIKKIVNIKV